MMRQRETIKQKNIYACLAACVCVFFILIFASGCAGSNQKPDEGAADISKEIINENLKAGSLPDVLKNRVFVYDELENDEGNTLYTLEFSENSYMLYQDGGVGVLAQGSVTEGTNRSLVFQNGTEVLEAAYTGSSFEEPAVTLNMEGKERRFLPAGETDEYVYLSYLGVYSAPLGVSTAAQDSKSENGESEVDAALGVCPRVDDRAVHDGGIGDGDLLIIGGE